MKTYKITEQRDGRQPHDTYATGLSLKEAQAKLLEFANWDLQMNFKNWGLVVAYGKKNNRGFSASSTHTDGTRGYNFDVCTYEIVEE